MKNFLLSCSLLGLFATANAQVSSLNEDFEGAESYGGRPLALLPYNGWEYDGPTTGSIPPAFIYFGSGNKFMLLNSGQGGRSTNTIYLFSPELTSVEGTLKFTLGGYTAKSGGRVLVGTVSKALYGNVFDTNTFKSAQEVEIPTNASKEVEIEIPADANNKYLAFQYDAINNNFYMSLDNIVFTPKTLSTTESTKENTTKFAVDRDALVFANKDIRSVKIYNANGSLVATEKVSQNSVNIAKLSTGVYFITIEDHNGNIIKSKFIKK